jgi:2-polyprenyl-3-methyl-5-hydroxy-6-metoxy-1,4-benzoquinol methylase
LTSQPLADKDRAAKEPITDSDSESAKAKAAHERYVKKPFPGSSHSWAFTELARLPSTARVLDFGPGSGVCGEFLKAQGLQHLYAVEIDEETRKHLSSTYVEIWDSIDKFSQSQFDAVIMLDVLEHTTDPFEVFAEVVRTLPIGGKVYISVPNIAHWSVRLSLLFGQFTYRERGLLDSTHYQFFTRKRSLQLVASQPSLHLSSYAASVEPVELLLPHYLVAGRLFRLFKRLHLALSNALPGLFAYQHLLVAEKIR